MSVVIPSAANRIFQEFSTEYIRAFDTAPRVWPEYGMEIPSSSRSTLHAWLSDQSAVREWKGSRILNEMGALTWEVVNKTFELSWKFSEYQIRDDLSGLTALAISKARGYGAKWARHEDILMAETIQAGVSSPCYDGQNFFSTAHPVDPLGLVGGTFSNYFTNKPLNAQNLITVLQQLRSYKLPDGSPWVGPGSDLFIMVDASNYETVLQLLNLDWLTTAAAGAVLGAGPSQNILKGVAKPVLNQYLNSEQGVWYIGAKVDGMAPGMFQRRQSVEADELGPGTQLYFDRKEYSIGQDARYAASYTHPQLLIRCEPV
jgi:phage major head subunit gpT-like protein